MIRTILVPEALRLGAVVVEVESFEGWRDAARGLLTRRVVPDDVDWLDLAGERQLLLGMQAGTNVPGDELPRSSRFQERQVHASRVGSAGETPSIRVPKRFTELAQIVACHRDHPKWKLLYRVLWRLTHGERELLEITTDDDVFALLRMEREVRSDAEAMKAQIRFRRLGGGADGHYVAWYRPTHRVLELVVPFLRRRFGVMQWSVFTPGASVHWSGEELTWGHGVDEPTTLFASRSSEQIERWWREVGQALVVGHHEHEIAHHASPPVEPDNSTTTNPAVSEFVSVAAANVAASAIQLTRGKRSAKTIAAKSAEEYLPSDVGNLGALREAALECRGCDLHRNATQTVFGVGPREAKLVLVGEQPGDVEDRRGQPFVGPAGKLLDSVLEEVGIDRSQVYLTNVVKHFKWTPRGKRRLHAKPTAREVTACRPWIEAELLAIQPRILVCLGATAIAALLGPSHRLTQEHGQLFSSEWAPKTMVTWHPSAILRAIATNQGAELRAKFVGDMKKIARLMRPTRSK